MGGYVTLDFADTYAAPGGSLDLSSAPATLASGVMQKDMWSPRAVVIAIAEADPGDAVLFSRLVSAAIRVLAIDPADLADGIGVSAATVQRWQSGRTSPAPEVRKDIYEWIRCRAREVERPAPLKRFHHAGGPAR